MCDRCNLSCTAGICWTRDGLRYLGVYLGNETIAKKINKINNIK